MVEVGVPRAPLILLPIMYTRPSSVSRPEWWDPQTTCLMKTGKTILLNVAKV